MLPEQTLVKIAQAYLARRYKHGWSEQNQKALLTHGFWLWLDDKGKMHCLTTDGASLTAATAQKLAGLAAIHPIAAKAMQLCSTNPKGKPQKAGRA